MATLPPVLHRLLSGDGDTDAAWDAFVAEHSRLLLHVARSVSRTHDDAMDAYTYLLDRLSEDDYRRLREFARDPRSKLTTWLVVVARRLSIDHYRQRYGRARGEDASQVERQVRRRLQDLIAGGLDSRDASAVAALAPDVDERLRETELQNALHHAVSTLDAPDQLLIRLRFHDDLAANEIARVMQLPSPFHVYRRINALLFELRRLMKRRGIESSVP